MACCSRRRFHICNLEFGKILKSKPTGLGWKACLRYWRKVKKSWEIKVQIKKKLPLYQYHEWLTETHRDQRNARAGVSGFSGLNMPSRGSLSAINYQLPLLYKPVADGRSSSFVFRPAVWQREAASVHWQGCLLYGVCNKVHLTSNEASSISTSLLTSVPHHSEFFHYQHLSN